MQKRDILLWKLWNYIPSTVPPFLKSALPIMSPVVLSTSMACTVDPPTNCLTILWPNFARPSTSHWYTKKMSEQFTNVFYAHSCNPIFILDLHWKQLMVESPGINRLLDWLAKVQHAVQNLKQICWMNVVISVKSKNRTWATDVMIFGPPLAPTTATTRCSLSTTTVGLMEETGRFPGRTILFSDGEMPWLFRILGYEKSSIWLLRIMPVEGDMNLLPYNRLMVEVTETASPE